MPDTLDKSPFEAATAATFVRRSVLVVPQATLAGTLKGKTPQYHAQIDKERGAALYATLCDEFRRQLHALDADARCLCGTYGNRQALDFASAGPSTHVFEF